MGLAAEVVPWPELPNEEACSTEKGVNPGTALAAGESVGMDWAEVEPLFEAAGVRLGGRLEGELLMRKESSGAEPAAAARAAAALKVHLKLSLTECATAARCAVEPLDAAEGVLQRFSLGSLDGL